ncbi:MAG: thioredoxin-disulfide reductase [Candidatus Lightella neohaematopini]|nr:thioredoxin-disulfide reductase [Candidatus Lightella neohaematopini]
MYKYNKLIILGSGPAGYTAAMYTARANLKPLLITGNNIGGQLINTINIENWPGEYNISGYDLMNKLFKQIKQYKIDIINDSIIKTNFSTNPFILYSNNYIYKCDVIIIAIGTYSRRLGLLSEKTYENKGISTCALCDGNFYKNKTVAIVGGGNTALEEALYLSNIVKKIYIIHRKDKFNAEPIIVDKIMCLVKNNKVVLYKNSIVQEILGNNHILTNIKIKNTLNQNITNININGLFLAIGHIANTDIFNNQLILKNNYICTNFNKNYKTSTSIPGIFAAGDIVYGNYRQAIVAAGSGCIAALDVIDYLNNF